MTARGREVGKLAGTAVRPGSILPSAVAVASCDFLFFCSVYDDADQGEEEEDKPAVSGWMQRTSRQIVSPSDA
jgi:hypothetical protein